MICPLAAQDRKGGIAPPMSRRSVLLYPSLLALLREIPSSGRQQHSLLAYERAPVQLKR